MNPLPFDLPAVSDLETLRAHDGVRLVKIYDRYPVAAARARTILSLEKRPERPVVVMAELESTGLTADRWTPEALLALFEGVGASALVLACPSDPSCLTSCVSELIPMARIPIGICLPVGTEHEVLPGLTSARLLLSTDPDGARVLEQAARELDFFDALPMPHDVRDHQPLWAVTCGQL